MRRTPSIQYGWKSMADQTCEQFTDGCLDRDLAEWIGDDLADLVLGQLIGDNHADLVCAYGEAITEGDAEVGPGGFAAFLSSL
ncbi:MAG: hypothetical protein KAJ37_01385, partial [Candidatus Krumholzibacteria bacterium]|nr:hypothetical protein [Candidatus Krumholzibacteria bacterium]